MTGTDKRLATGLAAFSFVLCAIRYWFPGEAYFDEVYYPKSAAEYLLGQPQFEWTHPPLTKMLIAVSMWLFGGMHSHLGDTGWGWRLLNVAVGAVTVYLLYVFAKRLTQSTLFASIAATLLVFDGLHFVQSRIATPEITVAFFCLAMLYTFYRYVERVLALPPDAIPVRRRFALGAGSLLAGAGAGTLTAFAHQTHGAPQLIGVFAALLCYAAGCIAWCRPRALADLLLLALACGLGAASKWNTLFDLVLIVAFGAALMLFAKVRAKLPLDAMVSVVMAATIAIYLAFYLPFFLSPRPVNFQNGHDLTGFMDLQSQMFTYHDVTVAGYKPHPYSSKWWEWPLIYQPIAYWYHDYRPAARGNDRAACCITEILALPNPLTWWSGLLTVPFLAYLAWVRRHRGYWLLVFAYFAQWLPWIASPRMLFEYHFFPDDAIILLADTIALQWLWEWGKRKPERFEHVKTFILCYVIATAGLFVYFYPVLAGDFVSYGTWASRMWFPHWIIGPG
ncbi:MAG: phospholipid carrier-dependent glycosyltransferase [Candidatus Baltobacteraceae bacterium]